MAKRVKKWEYMTIWIYQYSDLELSRNMGSHGWELVAVNEGKGYFRREIQ